MPTLEISSWRPMRILVWHLLAGVLVASWWLEPTRQAWDGLDAWVAWTLNGMLERGEHWQLFWAITNARIFDTAAAALMIALLGHYVFRSSSKEQLGRRLAEAAFIGLYLLAVVGITREVLFSDFRRESPSLVLEPFLLLSDLLPDLDLDFKVTSSRSFPGDHATVVAIFTGLFWAMAGWRYGLAAAVLGGFFVLPRLVGGAHWLTDTVMGGGVIAMVAVSWALGTPLAEATTRWLEQAFHATGDRIDQMLRRSEG